VNEPIDLYFWPTPNGWKISIALHEMNVASRLHLGDINAASHSAPEFLRLSPAAACRRSPTPTKWAATIPIFEAAAILQYLARKTGPFYCTSERERIEIDQWLFWQVGGVGPKRWSFQRGCAGPPGRRLSPSCVRRRGVTLPRLRPQGDRYTARAELPIEANRSQVYTH
jgi:glutathione S-transferase